jgi:hypothetical protein
LKKIEDFGEFCKLKESYLDICHQIEKHNRTHNQESHVDITKVNYKDLYEMAHKHPNAMLIMETPNQECIATISDNLKYLFSSDPHMDIQPMIPFQGMIANDKVIVLYATECPDLDFFDYDEIKKYDNYENGISIVKKYDKIKNSNSMSTSDLEADLWGYWIEDFYFEKNNWKSLHTGNKQFVNVFTTHKGNTSFDLILNPHY